MENTFPQKRFVRLKTSLEPQKPFTMTLVEQTEAPAAENNSILAAIRQRDPDRTQLIQDRLATLMKRNDEIHDWITTSHANALRFAQDPVGAIRQVMPDLPADFFDGWGTFSTPDEELAED